MHIFFLQRACIWQCRPQNCSRVAYLSHDKTIWNENLKTFSWKRAIAIGFRSNLKFILPLRWRHNGHDSVSNHQPNECLLNRLFRGRSKKTSKLRVTGLCAGKFTGAGEFPAQMASYAEKVSIWWRHHANGTYHNGSHSDWDYWPGTLVYLYTFADPKISTRKFQLRIIAETGAHERFPG